MEVSNNTFYKKTVNCRHIYMVSNTVSESVIIAIAPFFNLLPKYEKNRFINYFHKHLAIQIADKKIYNKYKLTKYIKHGDIQDILMNSFYSGIPFSIPLVYLMANYFNINIIISENTCGNFKYELFTPIKDFSKKGVIIIEKEKNNRFRPLSINNKFIFNPYDFEDLKKEFLIHRNKKGHELQPYYKYTIKDLQELAKKINLKIKKKGRGMKDINKSKKELYEEIKRIY